MTRTMWRGRGSGGAPPAGFFASPSGSATGAGTIGDPWTLQVAFDGGYPTGNEVQPGDTIWMRGGTYGYRFDCNISGVIGSGVNDAGGKIIVRSYPGEWAIIDSDNSGNNGDIFKVGGNYVWFRDFEITCSNTDRTSADSGPWPSDLFRGVGFSTMTGYGIGCKAINLVVHDTQSGFELWEDSAYFEAYGNIVYNNGWDGSDNGHGHAFYVQNLNNTKLISDNICLQSYGLNTQVFGSGAAHLNGVSMIGNVMFQAGVPSFNGDSTACYFGGGVVATDAVYSENATYQYDSPATSVFGGQAGDSGMNPATINDNYLANNNQTNGVVATFKLTVPYMTMTGNFFWGQCLDYDNGSNEIVHGDWPGNTWVSYSSRPTGTHVIVRPNAYESGRANVAIFNWDLDNTVNVDLSGVLTVGHTYEVRYAQNYFATPCLSGTYGGGSLAFPMTGLSAVAPVGGSAPYVTAPEFGAFVVRMTN